MQCDIARDLVGAYVDGELSGAERQAMAEHIASCPTCAAEADALRRVGEQLRVMGRAVSPLACRTGSGFKSHKNRSPRCRPRR